MIMKLFKHPIMKKKIFWISGIIVIAVIIASFAHQLKRTDDKDKVILDFVTQTLNYAHYDPQKLNDDFSQKVYNLYLKRLDLTKLFLLKEDVDLFDKYKLQVDDEIKGNSLDFFNVSFNTIKKRILEAQVYYKDILAQKMDFTKDESVETNPDKISYASTKDDLKEYWRKSLKLQVLGRLSDQLEIQEKAKATNDTTIKIKTFDELEADARTKVLKSENDWFRRMQQLDEQDRFSIFVNCVTNVYDPHTEYFPPEEKENFDITMTGHFEGIGATLQEDDGYIKVINIVPGSASWFEGELKVNDLILKVAQGKDEPVDVVGMQLKDAVKMIRGKKGTEVRLTVKKVDGAIKVISIIRDVVIIEETYAKSAVISKDGLRVGYIFLPQFYEDFSRDRGGRSSAEDVAKEIKKLKAENVDGIILDLRNNGGGALSDAVRMGGLFIKDGPIVQVKGKSNKIDLLTDDDSTIYYNGPLAIMVNSYSASASEILAAAMQDYHRAVIIGSKATFGKGTVQRFFELDDFLSPQNSNLKPLGSLKVTIQKFYRVTGGSTQIKGVTPDIVLPDIFSEIERGEKEQQFCMPWTEIPATKFSPVKEKYDLKAIKENSKGRITADPDFALIEKEAKDLKKQKDETIETLNLQTYRQQEKERKERNKQYDKLNNKDNGSIIVPIRTDEESFKSDTVKMAKAKAWYKDVKKDLYLGETIRILKDMEKK
jgi:carboxyl-terminal processing protease